MGLLRKLFGPSKKEIWQQVCAETGATFVEGGFWTDSKVRYRHGDWTFTLDSYQIRRKHSTHTYTRLRAPYFNPDGFRFTIYRQGLFSGLGKWFGMQDVEVGYLPFDDEFIVKGNDEQRIMRLFDASQVRELFQRQPDGYVTVKDNEGWFGKKFPPDADELYFQTDGLITSTARLKDLFDLFAGTLEQLCRIGAARPGDPDVVL